MLNPQILSKTKTFILSPLRSVVCYQPQDEPHPGNAFGQREQLHYPLRTSQNARLVHVRHNRLALGLHSKLDILKGYPSSQTPPGVSLTV